jgi:hypothetical protein
MQSWAPGSQPGLKTAQSEGGKEFFKFCLTAVLPLDRCSSSSAIPEQTCSKTHKRHGQAQSLPLNKTNHVFHERQHQRIKCRQHLPKAALVENKPKA